MINAAEHRGIQSDFILNVPGQNLETDNIVFTVKWIIQSFLKEYGYLLENDRENVGRPKTYKTDELLGFIVWGILNNKNSCRELENWVKNNDETCNYILNNKKPSKSTISRFHNRNILLIEELFRYTVDIGIKYDLVGCDHVTIYGTILKANASKNRIIRIDELEYLEKFIFDLETDNDLLFEIRKYFLEDVLDENNNIIIREIKNNLNNEALKLLTKSLMGEIENHDVMCFIDYLKVNYNGKNTISITDPECRWMKDKKGLIGLNYNYQVATDDKHDFIVAQKLVNDPTDHHQFIPMVDEIKMNLNRHPHLYTADNGYLTDKAAEYCYKNNIIAIMPDRTESINIKHTKPENRFKKHNFQYNWEEDAYICPQNQILKYQKQSKNKQQTIQSILHNQMQKMPIQPGMQQRKKKRNIPPHTPTKNKNERRLQFRSRKRNLPKKISHRRNLLRNPQKITQIPRNTKKNHKKSTNRTNTTNNSPQHKNHTQKPNNNLKKNGKKYPIKYKKNNTSNTKNHK